MVRISAKSLILDTLLLGSFYVAIAFFFGGAEPGEYLTHEELMNGFSKYMSVAGALFFGALLSAYAINKKGIKTTGTVVFDIQQKQAVVKPWFRTFWGIELLLAIAVFLYASSEATNFSVHELFFGKGFDGAKRIFASLLNPDLSLLPAAILAVIETIFIAFLATVLAIPIAFVLSFISAKNVMGQTPIGFAIYTFFRTVLNVIRSIEPLIWAIIFSVWVGIGPFAGMLSLMIHSVASLTKQYSEIIEGVEEGPIEGILSTGAGNLQVIWFAIVPQVVLPFISFTIYRWDINVRMATIIGMVGGGGIGVMLMQFQGQGLWREVGCLGLVIAVVVWAMDTASAYIREAIK